MFIEKMDKAAILKDVKKSRGHRSLRYAAIPFFLFLTFILLIVYLISHFRLADSNLDQVYLKGVYELPIGELPADAVTMSIHAYNNLTFQGLFKVDRSLMYVPDLVSTYYFYDSNRPNDAKLVLSLKSNLRFSDGSLIDRHHVIDSLNYLISKSRNKGLFYQIKSISPSKDISKIVIRFSGSRESLLAHLASPPAKIWRTDIGIKSKNGPIGSGPFFLQFMNSNRVELNKNGLYEFANQIQLTRLSLVKVTEEQAIDGIIRGRLHDIVDIYINKYIPTNQSDGFAVSEIPLAGTWILAINTRNAILKNLKIRKCLNESAAKDKFRNAFVPVHDVADIYYPKILRSDSLSPNSIFESGKPSCVNLFREKIELQIPEELLEAKKICTHFTESWKIIGVHLICKIVPFQKLMSDIEYQRWQISLMAITLEFPDQAYFFRQFHSKTKVNLANFRNPNYDRILEFFEKETSPQRKKELFSKLINIIEENNIVISLTYPRYVTYYNKCVTGLLLSPLGTGFINYEGVKLNKSCQIN